MPLYVVPTPIGNLEDITYRAIRVLREADLIACEDTRRTRHLLHHYGITTPTVSYHEHNERDRTRDLLQRLRSGLSVALVSDAGTPLISDPGAHLVQAALAEGLPVTALPGACAAVTALSASGLPTEGFRFVGFPPAKANARRMALEALADEPVTLVFYEAPHRLQTFLRDAQVVLGERPAVAAREITKLHETYVRGTLTDILAHFEATPPRGELVLLIAGKTAEALPPPSEAALMTEVARLVAQEGLSAMEAVKQTARRYGLPRRQVYQQWLRRSDRPSAEGERGTGH
ncbi:MAG: 16S rRNA (cytidine(1402)-2'-O)-methyltransferase [Chloracidobacterium sp.]|uniref:Ribosomal RNA small subunit methyltransferase I n=1 Tax=Chloracidobacterium validum TaxID=2821543 RepID=A0ABX8BD20_9BACT|nr:16S rRNA (cytidine(1402)-2'-O)-methyltransferase [Chloracidobacterium validum]QUW03554.1 16S rRNA (cytidine(1402)-2'-O)-methyltransferase [Chloracidobacterium validum]